MTRDRRRRGLTLLELVVSASIFSALSVLLLMVMTNSLNTSEREAAVNRMDMDANRAIQEITTTLRSAVIPVITDLSLGAFYPDFTYDPGDVDDKGLPKTRLFQDLVNSTAGFGRFGGEWHEALSAGTDFLPFATPVDFGGDNDQLDSNFLPELGIILPGDTHRPAADYYLTAASGTMPALNELRDRPMHPYLQNLRPEDFDIVTPPDPLTDVAGAARFAQASEFKFPAGSDSAYAVLRFSPLLNDADEPVILEEKDLLDGDGYDLNGDGTFDDSFAQGRLEVLYAAPDGDPITKVNLTGPSVLLQLNTDSPAFKPLFKLVSYSDPTASPGSLIYQGTPISDDGYAILVQLLLLDNSSPSNLAFTRKNGVPFLVRQYQTVVELRNLSRP